MLTQESLTHDLLPFVDIGTLAPKIMQKVDGFHAQFVRNGRDIKLQIDSVTGKVSFHKKGFPAKGFASLATMLASDDFANLRKWASSQAGFLQSVAATDKRLLPFNARTHKNAKIEGVEQINKLFNAELRQADAAEVILIDGRGAKHWR